MAGRIGEFVKVQDWMRNMRIYVILFADLVLWCCTARTVAPLASSVQRRCWP